METLLQWQSPEHRFDKKSNDWYWILGIISVGAAVLAFYFDNFLFGVFIIIAAFTIGILSWKETKSVQIKITDKGIFFGPFLYPWGSYRSFWIETEHIHGSRILLNPINNFLPLVIIPIDEKTNLTKIRNILLDFLEEEFLIESLIHKWFDKLTSR